MLMKASTFINYFMHTSLLWMLPYLFYSEIETNSITGNWVLNFTSPFHVTLNLYNLPRTTIKTTAVCEIFSDNPP